MLWLSGVVVNQAFTSGGVYVDMRACLFEYSYKKIISWTLPGFEIQKVGMEPLFSAKAICDNMAASM